MFPVDAKILIVDDSNFSRTVVKKGLKELRYWKMLEAESAKAARNILMDEEHTKSPIHLMICDIHMPEVNGLELLRWVRSQERLKDLPVIMLTSAQEKSAILEAGKLGVSHYMIKPFDGTTLKDRMSSAWEKHGAKWFEQIGQATKS